MIPISILFALCSALYPYIYFFSIAHIIDLVTIRDYNKVLPWIIFLIGFQFLFGMLLSGMQRFLEYKQIYIDEEVKLLVRKKVLNLDLETFEDPKTLEKINKAEMSLSYTGGYKVLVNYYQTITQDIIAIISSFAFTIHLLLVKPDKHNFGLNFIENNYIFTLVAILIFIFSYIVYSKLSQKISKENVKVFNNILKDEKHLSYFLFKVINDYDKAKSIRLFNMNEMIDEEYRKLNTEALKKNIQLFKLNNFLASNNLIFSAIINILIYLIAIVKIIYGAITIGGLTIYVGAASQFNTAISSLIVTNQQISKQVQQLDYFLDIMKIKNNKETGKLSPNINLNGMNEFEFHNVSFKYPGSQDYAIKNLTYKFSFNKRIAIVGKNGAGKSTFIKLLVRLYDPTEGYITLNGVNIRKVNYAEYLDLFGVVFQDFSMFAFPVAENIAVNTEYNEENIWSVLNDVGMKERVMCMPQKLKTPLFTYDDNGINASGGESQKLAIARALYKNAPFIILDEPTSALDPISEFQIYSNFNTLVKEKPCIYISHRMSSCRFCDEIIVFDKGAIEECGTHEHLLLNVDGIYYKLWNAQAQYYNF
jgi:ABC-type multidrug transport system fused ATPase/permease subunit